MTSQYSYSLLNRPKSSILCTIKSAETLEYFNYYIETVTDYLFPPEHIFARVHYVFEDYFTTGTKLPQKKL